MFDLFNSVRVQRNFRAIEFCGRYAIVTPFGSIVHQGQRKHIAYTWNKRFAQSLDSTIGNYWRKNPAKFARVAYNFA